MWEKGASCLHHTVLGAIASNLPKAQERYVTWDEAPVPLKVQDVCPHLLQAAPNLGNRCLALLLSLRLASHLACSHVVTRFTRVRHMVSSTSAVEGA